MAAAPSLSIGPDTASLAGRHDWLDDPLAWATFSRPLKDTPSCQESQVRIEGMRCAACALTIEQAIRENAGLIAERILDVAGEDDGDEGSAP